MIRIIIGRRMRNLCMSSARTNPTGRLIDWSTVESFWRMLPSKWRNFLSNFEHFEVLCRLDFTWLQWRSTLKTCLLRASFARGWLCLLLRLHHHGNRKLEVSTAPTKVQSREPAYSLRLIQNKFVRQRVRSRESGRQTVRRLCWMVFAVQAGRKAGRRGWVRIWFVEKAIG